MFLQHYFVQIVWILQGSSSRASPGRWNHPRSPSVFCASLTQTIDAPLSLPVEMHGRIPRCSPHPSRSGLAPQFLTPRKSWISARVWSSRGGHRIFWDPPGDGVLGGLVGEVRKIHFWTIPRPPLPPLISITSIQRSAVRSSARMERRTWTHLRVSDTQTDSQRQSEE